MKLISKNLIFIILMHSILYAGEEIQNSNPINIAGLETMAPTCFGEQSASFDSEENYKKLTNAYTNARTNKAYNNSIRAIYAFVKQHPEDVYSVDLLNNVSIFFPTWEADVNIPLYRKIVQFPQHPKIYNAHMTLYFYGKKEDKAFAKWNFFLIANDESHPSQKDAKEFLDAIGKEWD
jgi:hypothetical protein